MDVNKPTKYDIWQWISKSDSSPGIGCITPCPLVVQSPHIYLPLISSSLASILIFLQSESSPWFLLLRTPIDFFINPCFSCFKHPLHSCHKYPQIKIKVFVEPSSCWDCTGDAPAETPGNMELARKWVCSPTNNQDCIHQIWWFYMGISGRSCDFIEAMESQHFQ
jgi:hypothetical protein